MFSNLFERLRGSEDKPDPQSPATISHSVEKIEDLLISYKTYNQLISVTLLTPNKRPLTKASSVIIQIDNTNKLFATLTFHPLGSNQLLETDYCAQFCLNYQGTRHQFISHWHHSEQKAEAEIIHWFQFPKGIERLQLRNAFRVPISQANPVRASLTREDHNIQTGNLCDLSATGMRIAIVGKTDPKPGENFQACHFVLPDGNTIICRGQLIHWHFDDEINQTHIGIQFKKLNGPTQRLLNRYLTEVQRKHRQFNQTT